MGTILYCLAFLILIPLFGLMVLCAIGAFVFTYSFVLVEAVRFIISRQFIRSWGSLGLVLAICSVVVGLCWGVEDVTIAARQIFALLAVFAPPIRLLILIKQNFAKDCSEETLAYGLLLGVVSLGPLSLLGMYLIGVCSHR